MIKKWTENLNRFFSKVDCEKVLNINESIRGNHLKTQ